MGNYKTVTLDEIMTGCNRKPEDLLKEIEDRIKYFCYQIDGTYSLPFDAPGLFSVWKMIIRYIKKYTEQSDRLRQENEELRGQLKLLQKETTKKLPPNHMELLNKIYNKFLTQPFVFKDLNNFKYYSKEYDEVSSGITYLRKHGLIGVVSYVGGRHTYILTQKGIIIASRLTPDQKGGE